MRPSTTRFLTGFTVVAALGFGVVGAEAMGGDNANGPDAGIGIPGYNLQYEHSADGVGPGYPRYPTTAPSSNYQYSYRKFGAHHYRPY